MKLLLLIGVVAGGYMYVMTTLADVALDQVQTIGQTYQRVADTADQIATEE
jgi:hypothetical protein